VIQLLIVAVAVTFSLLTIPIEAAQPPVANEPPAIVAVQEEKKVEPIVETPKEVTPEPAPVVEQQIAPTQSNTTPSENESIAWNFLISQGFTRNQTAGIMGNLQQEHGFNTSDVPGGLGIVQWTSGRRAALINKGNYLDINVQLNYLMEELNGSESGAKAAVLAYDGVESATIAFQNKFERCGTCMQSQRIMYAYEILGRH